MTDFDDEDPRNHRRHPRLPIARSVRAVQGGAEHEGSLTDISLSGAAVKMDADIDDERLVALHIADMSIVHGQVARSFDDGFAIEFADDDVDEDPFLADIMRIHGDIRTEEF